jgi:hypothetical protein
MSNRNPVGVFDLTGASKSAVLAPGESVPDLSTGQVRIGDGKTAGGLPQVAQYPVNAFTAMLAANDRVYTNLVNRFVYPAGNFLWPGVRQQTNLCHQADTTTPPTAQPDLWAQATIHTPFYERWRLAQDQGDTATAAAVAAIIANTWTYTQQKWSLADLKALTVGTAIGYMDDGCHTLKYLMQVAIVTGDATAKAVIQEALAALLTSFLDPLQTGSDLYSYANVTPDGRALKWNQWGVLYPPPNDKGTQANTGYRSTIYEAKVAHVAAWLGQQTWVSAGYRTALLAYAKNRADFYFAHHRTAAASTPAKAVQGIHWIDMNLDPNVAGSVNTNFNGGKAAAAGGYDTNQTYHDNFNKFFDRPYRACTAHFPDGTFEIGCLNWQLWKSGAGASYLAEFESILQAVTSDHGYARDYHGVRLFGVFRDAWVDGQALGDLTRACRNSIKAGNTTTDPTGYFRQVVVNTARSIVSRSADGYLNADWMGRQYNPAAGTWTWMEDCANNYAGTNGSAFGHPRQLTTNGCAATPVGGAAGLAADGDPALLRSGVTGAWSIETLAAEVAALTAAMETKADLAGGQIFADPIKIKLPNTGFHHDGSSFYLMGDTSSTRWGFNRYSSQWEGVIGGSTWHTFGAGRTYHGGDLHIDQNIFSDNAGISANNNGTGGQLYLNMPGGFPGINLGASGFYINTSGGHTSHVAGGVETLRLQTGDAFIYGGLHVAYHITPTQDNNFNVGAPGLRYAGIYLGNNPNVTSDADTKTEVTAFTPAEIDAARAIAKLLLKFKSKEAVAKKGPDARWHSGALAQSVVQELQSRNLIEAPAGGSLAIDIPYDWVGHDTWQAQPAQLEVKAVAEVSHVEEVERPDGSTAQILVIDRPGVAGRQAIPAIPAGELYSIRYEALLVWIAAAHEQALGALEDAILALTSRVAKLEAA